MKKFVLSLFLFLIISLSPATVTEANAACTPSGSRQCGRGMVGCDLSGDFWCCPQIPGGNSCSQVPGSVQPTIPPNGIPEGNSDPTCNAGAGIETAIGCIPMGDTSAFMGWILGWAVGVGGGIAFLLIAYASFMVMTSQGIPDRLKAGQELLTSAISGLILLIFSVFILKFIGIDILGLDSFGFGN